MKLKISGMTCASCELLIEERFKKIPGISHVSVSHRNGKAKVFASRKITIDELNESLKDLHYRVSDFSEHDGCDLGMNKNTKRDYAEMSAVFFILIGAYLLLNQFQLLPKGFGIEENMSYGFVFVLGLVAAMSTCLAVTGGLLIALGAKYNESSGELTGLQKFRPHLYFNVGRLVSYLVLGGAVGALGSVLTLSPRVNGIITILASLVMVVLGFQVLKLFPWLKYLQPKMPKFIGSKLYSMSEQQSQGARSTSAFFIGAGTFFLPCGFTQALQLYVLSRGDMVTGALTMFIFALGTFPALMSLSAISSFAKGTFKRYFVKFAGVLAIMLGIFNMNSGFSLTGINLSLASIFQENSTSDSSTAKLIGGKQVVDMTVSGLDYFPHRFTVVKDVPVEWRIDGTRAEGCAQIITVPKLGIAEFLPPKGVKTISFTPREVGEIQFSCSMGMTTKNSAFRVVASLEEVLEVKPSAPPACDPRFADCVS